MKYVAFLPIIDQEKNKLHRPAHLDYINALYKEGKVFAAGPFTDGKAGLVIYNAVSYEEALELAKNDPVIVEGARTLELREWNPLSLPLD
ncbi:YciI family protein [Aneurinibacillus terranovensis]|uniref:YciI family protein n=1 Tax=Aneurinibacillus terranovensis TaxID=278991 RepID=UPI0004190D75|nr:YciI family protein [Aneurinibacillus terranovensis]